MGKIQREFVLIFFNLKKNELFEGKVENVVTQWSNLCHSLEIQQRKDNVLGSH